MNRLLLVGVFLASVSVAAYCQTCTGSTALKSHIYHPDRLTEAKGCITVSGKIIWKKPQADGDIHYRLKLDPGQGSGLINAKNRSGQHGALVFEPVCVSKIKKKKNGQPNRPALAACRHFRQNITIPNKHDRVEVTGIHVLDGEHGWLEIHPITKIKVLPPR